MYLDSLEVKLMNMQELLRDMLITVLYLILVSIPCCNIDTLQGCALKLKGAQSSEAVLRNPGWPGYDFYKEIQL